MTTLVHLSTLLPLLRPHVPMCPDPIATQALRLAAIAMCKGARTWRETLTLTVDPTEPALIPISGGAIHRIEHAMVGTKQLTPIAYTDAEERGLVGKVGTASHVTQTAPGAITLLPKPEAAVDVRLSLFLKPREDFDFQSGPGPMQNAYDVIPDHMKQNHGEALMAGACARLMVMPGKPWSNPELAVWWAGVFDNAVNEAAPQAMTGQQRAPIRSKAVWF